MPKRSHKKRSSRREYKLVSYAVRLARKGYTNRSIDRRLKRRFKTSR